LATNHISTDLPTRIQKLLEDRQTHEAAIGHIDEVLASVGSALGAPIAPPKRGPGRPAASSVVAAPPAPAAAKKPRRGRRSRGSYATTGDDSVLAFIKANKSPTTKDIKAHWAEEGRGGTADNVLSKLYREKKIKRLPLPGERGSRYAVA
jgi:hypothetical protein